MLKSAWFRTKIVRIFTFFMIFRTKMLKSALGYDDQYKTLKNRKTFLLIFNPETHEFAWFIEEFIKIFPNFWTELVRKTLFLFFEQKFSTPLALGFWQNRTFFMKKVTFFKILRKSGCFGENTRLRWFLFLKIKQIHGFRGFRDSVNCHRFSSFPFDCGTLNIFNRFTFDYSIFIELLYTYIAPVVFIFPYLEEYLELEVKIADSSVSELTCSVSNFVLKNINLEKIFFPCFGNKNKYK